MSAIRYRSEIEGYPKKLEVEKFITLYNVYKEKTKTSFELLNSINNANIYRVYPHKIFCNSIIGRCITHDNKHIFYYDDDHLSLEGSRLVNDQIMKLIQEVEIE